MTDLKARFEVLNEIEVPEFRSRAPRPSPSPTGTRHRLLVAAVALLIAAVPLLLLIRAFERSTPSRPAGVAPSGSWVISAHVAAERYEIETVSADGTISPPLNDSLPIEADPVWSPDGNRIAFSGLDNSNNEPEDVYVMNADGSGLQRVTSEPGWNWNPAWSPDGTRIAFSHWDQQDTGRAHIAVVDLSTLEITQLTPSSGQDQDPAWSPDGTKIAFGRNHGAGPPSIFVMNSDGSDVQRLTSPAPGSDSSPAWSPNGQLIAFARDPDQNALGSDIYVMNADGTRQRQLTSGRGDLDVAPTWSPDGNAIAFASAPEVPPTGLPPGIDPADLTKHPPSYDFRNMDVYVMKSDGSARRRITQDAGVGFSPDGFAGPQWKPTESADEGQSPAKGVNVIGASPEQAVAALKREILKYKARIAELARPRVAQGETPEGEAAEIAFYRGFMARLHGTLARVCTSTPVQGCPR
jgi:Tol biopolymer transport system component